MNKRTLLEKAVISRMIEFWGEKPKLNSEYFWSLYILTDNTEIEDEIARILAEKYGITAESRNKYIKKEENLLYNIFINLLDKIEKEYIHYRYTPVEATEERLVELEEGDVDDLEGFYTKEEMAEHIARNLLGSYATWHGLRDWIQHDLQFDWRHKKGLLKKAERIRNLVNQTIDRVYNEAKELAIEMKNLNKEKAVKEERLFFLQGMMEIER